MSVDGLGSGRNRAVLSTLRSRDGVVTSALLADGRRVLVRNIAWGYDRGDEQAHITTNISPGAEGDEVDFFYTSDVSELSDPETGAILFRVRETNHQ